MVRLRLYDKHGTMFQELTCTREIYDELRGFISAVIYEGLSGEITIQDEADQHVLHMTDKDVHQRYEPWNILFGVDDL